MKTLESRYLLGNVESRAWHQKFGFTEEPDLLLARTYYYYAQHELSRREKTSGFHEGEQEKLIAERDYWDSRGEEVEQISQQLGMEAVLPALRRS